MWTEVDTDPVDSGHPHSRVTGKPTQGRTQDFLKGGAANFFPCIVASRVRKINLT